MDATIKSLAPHYPTLQLTTLRFVSGAVFAWLLWSWFRTPMPRRRQWGSHLLRSALLLACLSTYFHSLTLLPLAQAVAMTYLAPICVALLAIVLLKERPTRWLWIALALGGAGVAVSMGPPLLAALRGATAPGAERQLEGLLAAGGSALAFSGVIVLARQQAQRDALWTILVVQNTLPLLVLGPLAAAVWQPVLASDLPRIVLVGAFATAGLLALTWAFTHIEASRAAPLEYTSFVWAAGLGYTLFGEVPSAATWLSAGLIVGGCLLLLRR
jgi:S-adenosylmethionine uptake transporter